MSEIDALISEVMSTAAKPTSKTFDKAGRGRKQCPECNTYVGVRTSMCTCGHDFSSDVKKNHINPDREDVLEESLVKYINGIKPGLNKVLIIFTPSGKCPLILDKYDYESVQNFCEELVDLGLKDGRLYMPSAIKLWLGKQLDRSSDKFKEVVVHLDKWIKTVSE